MIGAVYKNTEGRLAIVTTINGHNDTYICSGIAFDGLGWIAGINDMMFVAKNVDEYVKEEVRQLNDLVRRLDCNV